MADAERWLSVQQAIQGVMTALSCPAGPAQGAIVEACSAGLVRSRRIFGVSVFPLDREAWIELRENLLGYSSILINAEDLAYWLENRFHKSFTITDDHKKQSDGQGKSRIEPQKITKEAVSNDLLMSRKSSKTLQLALVTAIEELLRNGSRPGESTGWKSFCDEVRNRSDGWVDGSNTKPKRGCGDETIERMVRKRLRRSV